MFYCENTMLEHKDTTAGACGAAAVLLTKAAAAVSLSYELRGRLVVTPKNWVLLEVPNAIGNGAFQALHVPGAEQPTSSRNGRYNAHISAMRPDELATIGGAAALKERGEQFGFTLGPVRTIANPAGWPEVSKCWVIEARSTPLMQLRRAYGLGEPTYPFHITFAVLKRRKKASVWRHPVLGKQAVIRNPPKAEMAERKSYEPICPHCDEVMAEKHFVPDGEKTELWRHRGPCYDKGAFVIEWPGQEARDKEMEAWLLPEKKANAEEVIVKSLRKAVEKCPRDEDSGFLDFWYDMNDRRAKLNFGDWADGGAVDKWKTAIGSWADEIEVMDEAGGPGSGDWIKIASLSADLRAARKATKAPNSPEQAFAGNYAKGKVRMHGFVVSLENPKGSTRSGTDSNGKKWSITMTHDYGYIRGTEGRDGDHVDVFVGDAPDTELVFVVDQQDPGSKRFDEHKVMLGFATAEAAKKGYLANYEKGWQGLRAITAMTIPQFRWWLAAGDTKKPAAGVRVKAAADAYYRRKVATCAKTTLLNAAAGK